MVLSREVNWDTLSTTLEKVLHEWTKENIHTCMPGIIDTYDQPKRRANVRPALMLVMAGEFPGEDGESMERALAVNVPVLWTATSEYSMHGPLKPGDRGLLAFSERGIAAFKESGQLATPEKARYFDQADAVFYPGDFGHPPLTPATTTGMCMQTHDGRRSVRVENDRVELYCGETYIRVTDSQVIIQTPGDRLVVQ